MSRAYSAIGIAWAKFNENGEGKPRKHSQRVSFDHEKLISYATCVARYHTSPTGGKYVLAASNRYSVSTASHMSNCLGHGNAITIHVPNIFAPGGWALESAHASIVELHADNLQHLWQQLQDICANAMRRYDPDRYPWDASSWEKNLRAAYRYAELYLELTGFKGVIPRRLDDLIKWVKVEREAKLDAYYHPTAIDKRARAKEKREIDKVRRIAVAALHGRQAA